MKKNKFKVGDKVYNNDGEEIDYGLIIAVNPRNYEVQWIDPDGKIVEVNFCDADYLGETYHRFE